MRVGWPAEPNGPIGGPSVEFADNPVLREVNLPVLKAVPRELGSYDNAMLRRISLPSVTSIGERDGLGISIYNQPDLELVDLDALIDVSGDIRVEDNGGECLCLCPFNDTCA